MRFHLDQFNDFQEQFLVHPDLTYLGEREHEGKIYNNFASKTNWAHLAMPRSFDGRAEEGARFVWPWEIASFIKDIPAGLTSLLASMPKTLHTFFSYFDDGTGRDKLTQNDASLIVRNDLWQPLFKALGEDARFNELRPVEAKWCRVFAGLESPPQNPEVYEPEPADDPVKAIVAEVAAKVGVLGIATAAGAIVILLVIAAAVFLCTIFPLASSIIIPLAVAVIIFAALGWSIVLVASIVELVMKGLLLFGAPAGSLEVVQPLAAAAA